MSAFRIAVLASGSGTNLQAILDQLHGGDEGIEVVGVASDKPDAMALERARKAGVETAVFPSAEYEDRGARDAAIGDWLEERAADLVVLAGYMQLLSPEFVGRFRNRIDQRPSRSAALLPRHRRGAAGARPRLQDHRRDGPLRRRGGGLGADHPAAARADRRPVATGTRLEKAIHATEHALLPETIRLIAAGRVRIDEENPRLVHIDPAEHG